MCNGKYILKKDVYFIEANEHIGYGIVYRDEEQEISFEDISLCSEKLALLVEYCNSLVLSPIHLFDVVNDFLTDIV